MNDINNKIKTINNKEDFIGFLNLLITDLHHNSEEWQNKDLSSYLESMASWTEDMEGFYINNNMKIPENVDWKAFAYILIAAKMYE